MSDTFFHRMERRRRLLQTFVARHAELIDRSEAKHAARNAGEVEESEIFGPHRSLDGHDVFVAESLAVAWAFLALGAPVD